MHDISKLYFQIIIPSQFWPTYPSDRYKSYILNLIFHDSISRWKSNYNVNTEFEIFGFKSLLYCKIIHFLHLTVTLMVCWFIERFIFTHFFSTHWFRFSILPLSQKIGHVQNNQQSVVDGYSHVGDIVMLVTYSWWQF